VRALRQDLQRTRHPRLAVSQQRNSQHPAARCYNYADLVCVVPVIGQGECAQGMKMHHAGGYLRFEHSDTVSPF
jgi:hypothetical protein